MGVHEKKVSGWKKHRDTREFDLVHDVFTEQKYRQETGVCSKHGADVYSDGQSTPMYICDTCARENAKVFAPLKEFLEEKHKNAS